MTVEEKLKILPESSGVYLMYDAAGQVIYVGKAVVLKNRVRQYFMNTVKPRKVQAMVDAIRDFGYIVTLSEKDAFSLESNLIKKYKPKYNILLKDDKSSPYIRIDFSQEFPSLEILRRPHFSKKGKNEKLFGPYIGIRAAEVISVIKSAYKLRSCPKMLPKRACLNHHIGLCMAPCEKKVSKEEYFAALNKAQSFLMGKDDEAQRIIEQKLEKAIELEEFERAIEYREQLKMLKKLKERHVADLGVDEDMDGVAILSDGISTAAAVNIIRNGKMMGVKTFSYADSSIDSPIQGFLSRFYEENEIPAQICIDGETNEDLSALKEYLSAKRGSVVAIIYAKIGAKKRVVDMARCNAIEHLTISSDKLKRDEALTIGACNRLCELLKIKSAHMIECYDISNLAGTDNVASRAVFVNGRPEKSLYRRYKTRTVKGSDDYLSMKEVLTRRFNGDDPPPDLILIDGGKGQLGAAAEALKGSLGEGIPLISLAKRDEIIYTLKSDKPIYLSRNDNALRLLQRIRDEAHRFAITFNRSLRSKKLDSELLSIKGIGAKLKEKIFAAIPYSQLKTMTAEQISQKAKISINLANSIVEHFKE